MLAIGYITLIEGNYFQRLKIAIILLKLKTIQNRTKKKTPNLKKFPRNIFQRERKKKKKKREFAVAFDSNISLN